jgi:hypothetical protein
MPDIIITRSSRPTTTSGTYCHVSLSSQSILKTSLEGIKSPQKSASTLARRGNRTYKQQDEGKSEQSKALPATSCLLMIDQMYCIAARYLLLLS